MKLLPVRPILAATIGALISLGCATTYQSKGFTGGFSETQLAENIFQVRFRGNAYTSMERATDFTLLRSAELALQHGYPYFVVIDDAQHVDTSTYTTQPKATTNVDVFAGTATTTYAGGETYVYRKPSVANTIVCFKERPGNAPVVFEAAFIQQSIRAKYGLVSE